MTSVQLPEAMENFVRHQVATGNFQTEQDVICAGLELMMTSKSERQFIALKNDLQFAVSEVKAGKVQDFDPAAFEPSAFE